ncbi:MAG: type 1 glutamine amidotransferase [Chloroflexi bacterium]|nr:type 1 glutamine amidotransferase [Chloroflexota bacterium]
MGRKPLEGMRVAALVADGVEQKELTEPKEALEQAGAKVDLVSPERDHIQGMHHLKPGDRFTVDVPLDQARPEDYDALLIPGGAYSPDKLRMDERALDFVASMDKAGRPIAAICHGPWVLVSAGLVQDRTLTSYRAMKDDVTNAGGNWVDQAVVVDRNWVSSREPRDIPDFVHAVISRCHRYLEESGRMAA